MGTSPDELKELKRKTKGDADLDATPNRDWYLQRVARQNEQKKQP